MRKVAVLGFGKSGKAAYKALRILNNEVFVFDDKQIEENNDHFFFGGNKERFYDLIFDEVVVSPGISKFHPFIQHALKNGISVISELELGYKMAQCPIIAVTGTNGKTTTVALIQKIMESAGKRAASCGNYGLPLSEAALKSDNLDYLIVEASSYQLEFINEFKPFIGAILNIGSDHVKWHGSKDEYRKAKLNIFRNQDESDYFIKNEKNNYRYNSQAELLTFSKTDKKADCFLEGNKIIVNYKHKIIIDDVRLFGCGNLENIAVSALAAEICGIDNKIIMEVSRKMENLPNRIEFIGELDGVRFYNDSKSTNIDSVVNALNSFDGNNIVVILGGKHKGESFSTMIELLENKTRAVLVYGEDKHIIMRELENLLPIPMPALDVRGALIGAFELAAKGDVVLFSPGGSSCEPYKNYEERGESFKKEFAIFKEYYENAPKI